MSTSGTLSYYVDSLILPESEELSGPRYPSSSSSSASSSVGLQQQHHRQSITEHTELGTCAFPAKPPVFGPTWSHVPAQFPAGVYHHHHYAHPQGPVSAETDPRYQSWLLEPMSGSLPSMAGLPSSHHYGIKPEAPPPGSHTALLLSDYATASPGEKDALSGQLSGDGSGEAEEKPGLDPSKSPVRL